MRKDIKPILRASIIFVLIFLPIFSIVSAQEAVGMTLAHLNVRAQPSANSDRLGQAPWGTELILEGRNSAGDWVLGHTRDNSLRGWVSAEYLDMNVALSSLPVVDSTAAAQNTSPTTQTDSAPASSNPGVPSATTRNQLNLRAGPGTSNSIISVLSARTTVLLDGRNAAGDWVLIHTPDNSLTGWVAVRLLTLNSGVSVQALPLRENSSAVANAPAPQPVTGSFSLSPGVIENARAIFQRGRSLGNRANVFTKVGDSITSVQPFFLGFGLGEYNLGSYTYLQDTINFFSVSPRNGVSNSFVNPSQAASAAFTSAAVLDTIWGDPNLCEPDEAPLLCEYRITKPGVAIIMLGSIDVRILDLEDYQEYLTRVVDLTLDNGIIPVLTTFPNGASYYPEKSIAFNNVIRSLAASKAIPLIELREPVMTLPNNGVREDQFHLSQNGEWYNFNGDEQRAGITMRNFLTLQALDILRREVLTR